jgi:CBS domain containing-hemolysin-like protein
MAGTFELIFVLILVNALFVAAEFAIIGAPKASIEHAAARGSQLARSVLQIVRDPRRQDRFVATAQLGITFASLALGMFGEPHVARALLVPLAALGVESLETAHALATASAVVVLTYLHIVLGEMVPKTLALQHATKTALFVSKPMHWVNRLLWPLVAGLEAAGNALLRRLGVYRGHAHAPPTRHALRFMVAESVSAGELDASAGDVVEELFAFSELSAGEVMVARTRIVALPVRATPEQMRKIIRSARHSRYPVYDGTLDQIVGMILVRDVLKHLHEGTSLADSSVRPIPFVPVTARLDVVLSRIRNSQTQMVVVMDEQGGTAGIVTTEDLFEEVVGQVADGTAGRAPVYEEAGELRALGVARIGEVADQLNLDLVHPEVDTVSGLVLWVLNRPPHVGDVVVWRGLELRVRSVEGRGVGECSVKVLGE